MPHVSCSNNGDRNPPTTGVAGVSDERVRGAQSRQTSRRYDSSQPWGLTGRIGSPVPNYEWRLQRHRRRDARASQYSVHQRVLSHQLVVRRPWVAVDRRRVLSPRRRAALRFTGAPAPRNCAVCRAGQPPAAVPAACRQLERSQQLPAGAQLQARSGVTQSEVLKRGLWP